MITLLKSNIFTDKTETEIFDTVEEALAYIESDKAKRELEQGIFFSILDKDAKTNE